MTDESLREEVEALKAKNAQLLDERKKGKGNVAELEERLQKAEQERDALSARLHEVLVEAPRQEMMSELCVEGMAGAAMREIEHHFDVIEEDGKQLLRNKDGSPVEIETKGDDGQMVTVALELDHKGIEALYEHNIVPALGRMLKGSPASGGGAPGSMGSGPVASTKPRQQTEQSFGIR